MTQKQDTIMSMITLTACGVLFTSMGAYLGEPKWAILGGATFLGGLAYTAEVIEDYVSGKTEDSQTK